MKKKSSKKIGRVIKHLKGDIKSFKDEVAEDKELINELREPKKRGTPYDKDVTPKRKRPKLKKAPKTPRAQAKIKKVMSEFKAGDLRSGSKRGPKVTNPKQAIAIAISESRRKKRK